MKYEATREFARMMDEADPLGPAWVAASLRSVRNRGSARVRSARYWKCRSVTRVEELDMGQSVAPLAKTIWALFLAPHLVYPCAP